MFTAPRYIAIDDDPKELAPLVQALHDIGAPCVGIHFDPLGLPGPPLFDGVRVLFTDLHLVQGAASANQHYDAIAQLLDTCVPAEHGPYLLVLWTSHEEERQALIERLQLLLEPDKMPIALLAMGKEHFRNGADWDGPALQKALRDHVTAVPQIGALLSWEQDVLAAANATLALVGGLLPAANRTLEAYADGMDGVLSLLATTAVGDHSARDDPRGAVASALAPLLADRIVNQGDRHGTAELWKRAVTFQAGSGALDENQKATMHRMVHFAVPPAEPVTRTDWGAIIPFGAAQLDDDAMRARYGVTAAQLREKEFKLKANSVAAGRLVLIRGGAACDQAQNNPGPLPMLLGLLAPTSALQTGSRSPAVHVCPERLLLDGDGEPSTLLVSARFTSTLLAADLVAWPDPILRIREQLLMALLVHSATHAIRPGTLRF
jgi:hypothetical protein